MKTNRLEGNIGTDHARIVVDVGYDGYNSLADGLYKYQSKGGGVPG